MRIESILFIILSFLNIIDFNEVNNEDIKRLEGQMIYYYIAGYYGLVQESLNKIKNINKKIYKRDEEIMKYWQYIDETMQIYENVAPDGLPNLSSHAFVVLGYALNADGSLKQEAKGRCDVAYESSKKYPNAKIYLTGGGTASGNKTVTEAGQMQEYLVNVKRMDKSKIVLEDKAMTTIQNAKNTVKKLINNNITTITIVTSDYHIRRGSILFKGETMLEAEQLGIQPIKILENAAYKTGRKTEGKLVEGYNLGTIMGVKVSPNMIFNLLPEAFSTFVTYYFQK